MCDNVVGLYINIKFAALASVCIASYECNHVCMCVVRVRVCVRVCACACVCVCMHVRVSVYE